MHNSKHSLESRQKMGLANKGRVPWNKGKTGVYSTETRQAISNTLKGNTPWNKGKTNVYSEETRQAMAKGRLGKPSWNSGKTGVYTAEVRKQMGEANVGRKPVHVKEGWMSEEHQEALRQSRVGSTPWNKDKTGVYTEETRKRMSEASKSHVGELASNWQGGITPANTIARHTDEYHAWRDAVFARDNYTCQMCEEYGGTVHADHIKPFAKHPELRYDVDNGRTLCRACHYYITFKRKLPITSKWGLARKR